jgi:2-oxoacid:acceptor oxidoreductase gamma subunit (pyruvate/2-ketoisovalerate family)
MVKTTVKNKKPIIEKNRTEILIVGKGGEGVASAAEILGFAATYDGKYSSCRNTYGASQRGEAIFSEVIISDDHVQFPFVEIPDYFIAFSQQGFYAYNYKLTGLKTSNLLIESSIDYDLEGLDKKYKTIKLNARGCMLDNGMSMNISNMAMLGGFIKYSKILSKVSLEKAVAKKIPNKYYDENVKAIDLGYQLISE